MPRVRGPGLAGMGVVKTSGRAAGRCGAAAARTASAAAPGYRAIRRT